MVVTHHNFRAVRAHQVGETGFSPSKTVPDMVQQLPDLLVRLTRGQDVTQFQPVYTDDESIPANLERMSAQDRLDYAAALRNSISNAQNAAARSRRVPAADSVPSSQQGEKAPTGGDKPTDKAPTGGDKPTD